MELLQRGRNQAAREAVVIDPFRTRDHVRDFDAIAADYRVASGAVRGRMRAQLNLAYGPHADERLDLFFPEHSDSAAPIHLFIHGGYWRANCKEDYAFIAETVTATGAIAAIVEYTLMPKVRMTRLIDQVRRAALWLASNANQFGGDATQFSASGHSAGAHLAFYLIGKGPHEVEFPPSTVSRVLLVSGIYDLAPISVSFLQPEIELTSEEIAQWSPVGAEIRTDITLDAMVGSLETTPFHAQAAALAERFALPLTTVSGLDHMTIVRELGRPDTPAAALLKTMIAKV